MTSQQSKPHLQQPIDTPTNHCLHSFFGRLESPLALEVFQELEQFECFYERLCNADGRSDYDELGVSDPAISVVEGCGLEVDGATALGGSVAGVMEKLANRKLV